MPQIKLTAGSMIHIVRVEKPNDTQDALGRPTGWTPFVQNVPARVEDISGRETYLAGRFVDQVSHLVKMRYLPGVKGNMRVIWEDRILEIQAILQPDGKRIEHQLVCVESNV
jgi:SPP1 family predicted phage head-tail adaptor